MKKAEYFPGESCQQRNRAEYEKYAGAQSVDVQEVKEQDGADLLERILNRDNLNRAYERVRANKGAPGIDGMTVEEALPWLREHIGRNFWKASARGNTSPSLCAGRKFQSRTAGSESWASQLLLTVSSSKPLHSS